MALILPFLLAFVGGATDLARVYAAWMTLESSARSAAEYVASDPTIMTPDDAVAAATKSVCLESQDVPGFTPGSGSNPKENCTAPAVTVPDFDIGTTSIGNTAFDVATVHVRATLDFQTLVPYPMLPNGTWTLTADTTYSVIRGR